MIPQIRATDIHHFCRLSTKYDEKDADKNFTCCLKRTNGKVTVWTVVFLCRTHGMDMKVVRQRLIEQRESLNPLTSSSPSPPLGVYSEDELEEEIEVVSKDADPNTPLPTFGKLCLPYPLDLIYERGQTPQQCDAMLLTALTVMGAAMDWHVRTKYSDFFQYPCLQLFVMAPSASGKGAMARVQILEKIQAKGIIELRLSEDQMYDFDSHFSSYFQEGQLTLNGELDSTVIRQAINAVRIMSIVAVLREFEKHDGEGLTKAFFMGRDTNGHECNLYYLSISDDDFLEVLTIFECLYYHAIHVLSFLKRTETEHGVLTKPMIVLKEMPDEFTHQQWMEECEKHGINSNYASPSLGKFKKKVVVMAGDERGKYIKVVQDRKKPPRAERAKRMLINVNQL